MDASVQVQSLLYDFLANPAFVALVYAWNIDAQTKKKKTT
jgi:hypothetical protein